MVRYKKKLPTKSPRAAVTAAPPSAGDQSLGSVSRSTRSQQRLQNDDTASLSASARTVAVAIADGDISEKSNEDDTDKEEDTEQRDTWHDMISQYSMAMVILRKRSDYTDDDIDHFQDLIDDFWTEELLVLGENSEDLL